MDALDIPRLRGVTHAYAFWIALAAAITLIVVTPAGVAAGRGGDLRRRAVRAVRRLAASTTAGAGIRAGARSCAGSTTRTIYVFIAACYTPVAVLVLEGGTRWAVLVTVWAGAHAGRRVQRGLDHRAARGVRDDLRRARLGRGDLPSRSWSAALPLTPLILMAAGGVLYTVGAVDLRARPPEPVAADLRLPRDLPRVRDPGRRGALRRMAGWIVMHDGVSIRARHRRPAPASRRAAACAHARRRRRLRPPLPRGLRARAGRARDHPDRRRGGHPRRAVPGSCSRAPAWRSSTA